MERTVTVLMLYIYTVSGLVQWNAL